MLEVFIVNCFSVQIKGESTNDETPRTHRWVGHVISDESRRTHGSGFGAVGNFVFMKAQGTSEAKEQGMWLSLQACLELNITKFFFFFSRDTSTTVI